jgi:hypothetical protein
MYLTHVQCCALMHMNSFEYGEYVFTTETSRDATKQSPLNVASLSLLILRQVFHVPGCPS